MATRTTKKTTPTKPKTTKPKATSTTKTSTQKRKTTSKAKQKSSLQSHKRLYAILFFALGIFITTIAIIPGSAFWAVMHNSMLGLFSWCAYLIGPIIIYTAIMIDIDKSDYPVIAKLISCAVLVLLLCGALQIFSGSYPPGSFFSIIINLYEQGITHHGGGVFAIIIGIPLLAILGHTGAMVTIITLIFVAIMILSGGTLIGVIKGIFVKPVKKMEQAYTNAVETRESAAVAEPAPTPRRTPKPKVEAAPPPPPPPKEKKTLFDVLEGEEAPPPEKPAKAPRKKAEPKPRTEPDLMSIDEIINRAVSGETTLPPAPDMSDDDGLLKFNFEDELSTFSPEPPIAVDTPTPPAEPVTASFDIPLEDIPQPTQQPVETTSEQSEDSQDSEDTFHFDDESDTERTYRFPTVDMLQENTNLPKGDTTKELKANADRLVDTLKSFGVQTRIVDISRGPAVTRYELQPSAGVKISRITGLADDIALNLASAGVRIEAPIPNKAAIGIEVPNRIVSTVQIREILESPEFVNSPSKLTVALGRDISGNIAFADLAKMPHTLIAGATGSGKSVCINSLIISILYKAHPDEVKLLMIDPKVVELGGYNGIPHLISPVVTEPKKAAGALCTMVGEMLKRYKLFAQFNVRDISGYNRVAQDNPELEKMPQIVIIIDELADLMMASPKDVEDYICRLAQMARAAGMHLVIATQRPSVDVITGVIKANIPSRISFAVSSQIDSRTILDMGGAEKLLGRGDMLYSPVGSAKPTRVQGCFVTDTEVEKIVNFIKESSSADYDNTLMEEIDRNAERVNIKGAPKASSNSGESDSNDGKDELLNEAIKAVVEAGQASTSLLQRKLKVGYARAARIVDQMEEMGVVGGYEGSKPRQVLISKERFYEMQMNNSD